MDKREEIELDPQAVIAHEIAKNFWHGFDEYYSLRIAIQEALSQARSQAYEEIAAYVEGKGGNIPGASIFAPLVSRNRMPDMSGDPRARLSPTSRREFDDATRDLAQAIRQHSQKGGEK